MVRISTANGDTAEISEFKFAGELMELEASFVSTGKVTLVRGKDSDESYIDSSGALLVVLEESCFDQVKAGLFGDISGLAPKASLTLELLGLPTYHVGHVTRYKQEKLLVFEYDEIVVD